MKKLLLALSLLVAPSLHAQSTTVSATITDTGGQAWAAGTYTFTFRVAPTNPTATYYWNGVPFPMSSQTIQGTMDNSGHFSVSVPSNTSITPSQSTWDLQVCPVALGNTTCYTQPSLTITGATQNLSFVHPPAISIDLAHPAYPFVVAYTSAEITTAPLGGLYYDWTQAHYFICEAINPTTLVLNYGTCTLWVKICQAGDTSCGGGGGGTPHNLLSTTHLDTIPNSPPTRGDLVTAQNLTSPSSVTPAWARLALGTSGQFLGSNGTDALWRSILGGTNITVSNSGGNNTVSVTNNSTTVDGSTCTLGSVCNAGHHGLEFTIYNGGTGLTSGATPISYALMSAVPFACTIDGWSLAADQGTATIKWWKVGTGTAIPAAGNSINTSGVQLSTGTKIDSTNLSDFTTIAIAKNDSIIFDIFAVSGGMTYLDGVLSCHE